MKKILMFLVYTICMPISETILFLYENIRISKKVFSICLLSLLMITGVSAVLNDSELYYSADDNLNETNLYGVTGTTGILDGAYEFDGADDYMETGYSLSTASAFSIYIWINPTNTGLRERFIGFGDDTRPGLYMELTTSNQLKVALTSGTSDTREQIYSFGYTNWKNIVITYSGSGDSFDIYIDNTLQTPVSTTGNINSEFSGISGNLVLGGAWNYGLLYEGLIDEVAIYQSTLTSTQISNLYQSGTPTQQAKDIVSNPVFYTSMDSLDDLSSNSNYGQGLNGVTTGVTGILNEAYEFDGVDDYIQTITNPYDINTGDFSVSLWINTSHLQNSNLFTNKQTLSGTDNKMTVNVNIDGTIDIQTKNSSARNEISSLTYSTGVFNHVVLTRSGAQCYLYVNNVNESIACASGDISSNDNWKIGNSDVENSFDGVIDEFAIYSKALSATEVSELYNSGTGYNPYSTPLTPTAQITFTNITFNKKTLANDTYFNTSEITSLVFYSGVNTNNYTNLSYSLYNSSGEIIENYQFKNDTITIDNPTKLGFPIAETSGPSSTTAENWCLENYNGGVVDKTTNLQFENAAYTTGAGTMWSLISFPTDYTIITNITCENGKTNALFELALLDDIYNISFYAENNETNTTTSNYTFIVDTTNPIITFNNNTEINSYTFNESILNITCTDNNLAYCFIDWDDGNITNSTTGLFNNNKTFITNGNHTFNITNVDLAGNSITTQGQLFINPYQYFYVYDLYNSTLLDNFSIILNNNTEYSSNNGYVNISLQDFIFNSNNTLMIDKLGYRNIIYTIEINNTSNYNLTLNTTQALLYLYIRDATTGDLITESVDILLSAEEVYSNTYNTSNGSIVIDDISFLPSEYNIRLEATNYTNSEEYITFNGLDDTNITMYLQSESTAIELLIIVRDADLTLLGNIYVSVKQYDFNTNSYILISTRQTNDIGQVYFDLDWNQKYQFILTDGVNTITKAGQYITVSPLYLEFEPFKERINIPSEYGIYSYIYFQNNTYNSSVGLFGLAYDDPSGIIENTCINVYKKVYNNLVLVNVSCSDLSSATIFSDNINIEFGKTYVIKATGVYDGETIQLDEQVFIFPSAYSKTTWAEGLGLFFSFTLFLILIFGAMENEAHPIVLLILSIIPLLLGAIFGSLPVKLGAIITFGGLMFYIVLYRREK